MSILASPWVTMWVTPRATIRRILDSGSRLHRLVLPVVFCAARYPATVIQRGWSTELAIDAAGSLVLWVGYYLVVPWLLRLTGRWLRGRASVPELRSALLWGSVPYVEGNLIVGSLLLMLPPEVSGIWGLAVILFMVTTFVWMAVVAAKAIGEAQGFSAWRGYANYLLTVPIWGLPLAAVSMLATE